jgi:hypothetical protein
MPMLPTSTAAPQSPSHLRLMTHRFVRSRFRTVALAVPRARHAAFCGAMLSSAKPATGLTLGRRIGRLCCFAKAASACFHSLI